jgi:sec-independent protein translocase protein TatA
MGELIVILLIVLVVFGANKLPGIGDALGRSIKNFKRASAGEDEIEVNKKKSLAAKRQAALEEADEEEDEEEAEVVPKRKVAKAKTAEAKDG